MDDETRQIHADAMDDFDESDIGDWLYHQQVDDELEAQVEAEAHAELDMLYAQQADDDDDDLGDVPF